MNRPVIFLDVDGVLNQCGRSGFGIMRSKVGLLVKIYKETDCLLVLSSTWRLPNHSGYPNLVQVLDDEGLVLYSKTPDLTTLPGGCRVASARPRYEEIQAWLDENPEARRFAILDDEKDFGPLSRHHFLTRSEEGLTDKMAEDLIAFFSTSDCVKSVIPAPRPISQTESAKLVEFGRDIAEYILAGGNEEKDYDDWIAAGEDPLSHVFYKANRILNTDYDFDNDIENYHL